MTVRETLTKPAAGCCASAQRPMLSAKRKESLGSMYTLVGTHSAVKLCRWQKSMLRGRGGCYKWTMYGIKSHQCMEATPSMACANNCVFCWRLNTNPTASKWRWQVDDPKEIVEGMLSSHVGLIREVRGMPGVTEDALAEALQPRHCALSLVGEPILYPYVNTFLQLLHEKQVSTFLVNNGQFPEALQSLAPVTQLYLSVDAPNKETMKILDRPILPDYWERFNTSVDIMRAKKGRTVFRLTMIDGFNMSEDNLMEYKDLFERGVPDFIEIKRLTPAFSGNQNTILRIKNVPTWERMKEFSAKLCNVIGEGGSMYAPASIHEHSGCILLAHHRFFSRQTEASGEVDNVPMSWINFDRFHELMKDSSRDPSEIIAEDFLLPTPTWARWGAPSEGFDPDQERHITSRRRKYLEGEAMAKNAKINADQTTSPP